MEAIISLLALIGMGYGAFRGVKWLNKANQAHLAKEPPLTPNDLKVLEESAARLMADIRSTTDECVARIEEAYARAESRMSGFDTVRSGVHPNMQASPTQPITSISVNTTIPAMQAPIGNEDSLVAAARQSGMTTGEIELLRGLKSLSA